MEADEKQIQDKDGLGYQGLYKSSQQSEKMVAPENKVECGWSANFFEVFSLIFE